MSEIINFTVTGNQEDPDGNPLGYVRTLNHSWRNDAVRYVKWKAFVQKAFRHAGYKHEDPLREEPLTTTKDKQAKMDIEIYYKNDARSDCDNVYKGIADSLFKNDKYLMAGSFTGKVSPDKKGYVTIKITFTNGYGY